MAEDYTYAEMADMYLCYGRAYGSARRARRIYHETFPNRRIPCDKTFSRLDQRLRDHGSFSKSTVDSGRRESVRTPQLEERILDIITRNPGTSTRRIAAAEGVSKCTVWNVLHDQMLYPYHVQRVQGLQPTDYHPRRNFFQWFLRMDAENPQFLSRILFTDEAGFTKDGIFNFHNTHVWADENPHSIMESRHQHKFSINVWAGIIGDFLIGPFLLPNRLTGPLYRDFLENSLPELLEDVPLEIRRHMWFMHDGAPPHFSITARQFLNEQFPARWIGRGGPTPWPARSPDANPLDFFLWGYLKQLVYASPVNNVQELRERVQNACQTIRNNAGIFGRVRQSLMRRANACIAANGGHFEHLL